MDFDLVVKNGRIVTAFEILPSNTEIGIKDGKISCLGISLPLGPNTQVLDAQGGYITPGGVDSHVHLAQGNAPTGDNWETGSRSAIAGGTTTVIAFASQNRDDASLFPVVEEYHLRSRDQSYCDYGFHLILTNPSKPILEDELPVLVEKEGITSVKLYMTYDPLRLGDREMLDVFLTTRALGMTTMVHAENHDIIQLITQRLEERRLTEPYYHAISRPQIAENEATNRVISLAELTDTPILIVHMSAEIAVNHVRKAQARLLPIHAETCPQYLFLLSERIKGAHFEGAKCVCSPPLRHEPKDLDQMWRNLSNGTFTTISSDHAPSMFDHEHGKKAGLKDGIPCFRKIPNGLPGLETRMPLVFHHSWGAEKRLSLPRFVQLTATNPAKLYGLDGIKGSIAPGYDADLVIWYPQGSGTFTIEQKNLHHGVDYTPYEGMVLSNWPRYTVLRGKIVWNRDDGGLKGEQGYGQYLKRSKGIVLTGRVGSEIPSMLKGERELWM